jgi:hypothetical protein
VTLRSWSLSTVLYCTVLYWTVLYDRINWLYGVKKICIKWLWPVKVTFKVIKRRLKVFCWSCDGCPFKMKKKIAEPPVCHYGSNEPNLASQFEWLVNTFKPLTLVDFFRCPFSSVHGKLDMHEQLIINFPRSYDTACSTFCKSSATYRLTVLIAYLQTVKCPSTGCWTFPPLSATTAARIIWTSKIPPPLHWDRRTI